MRRAYSYRDFSGRLVAKTISLAPFGSYVGDDGKRKFLIFDPLKSNKNAKGFIYMIMHECEYVWQWVNYPDIMKFFAVNRKVYIES